ESFSYSVSHDLRAPLRAISGFAEIIVRRHQSDLNEEGQRYFRNIVQAGERMGQLIDDLLTYSRLGRAGIQRERIKLDDLLKEIVMRMGSTISKKQGTLVVAEGLPPVMGDRTLLSQIFINLLDNAIKYHRPDTPPQVTVDFRNEDHHVIISVKDRGIGIPIEYQQKIFDIFQRLHPEDEYPGTGVGLSTVKKAAELLGGKIWIESQVGHGSTFFVK
ncbi:GHKL domain-containing protein, partial [bacterium]|nr:GHKL domain-containing protein [bacterium]